MIFQKIIKLEYEFPEKFFPKAKDLVQRLLVRIFVSITYHHFQARSLFSFWFQSLDPRKRLGCEEMGGFNPLKGHMFFETISWENLPVQIPPKLTPYLPAMAEDDEDYYGNVSSIYHTYYAQCCEKLHTNSVWIVVFGCCLLWFLFCWFCFLVFFLVVSLLCFYFISFVSFGCFLLCSLVYYFVSLFCVFFLLCSLFCYFCFFVLIGCFLLGIFFGYFVSLFCFVWLFFIALGFYFVSLRLFCVFLCVFFNSLKHNVLRNQNWGSTLQLTFHVFFMSGLN